jgi:hypothetical protein
VRMEHFSIADMFGRRPKPLLVLDYKLHDRAQFGPQYQRRIELGLRNEGRGPARSPYLAIRPSPPFFTNHYGVDGNGNQGLPILLSFADRLIRFGGSSDTIIHPGTTHPVTILSAEYRISSDPTNLTLTYEICAEGQQLEKGEPVRPWITVESGVRDHKAPATLLGASCLRLFLVGGFILSESRRVRDPS